MHSVTRMSASMGSGVNFSGYLQSIHIHLTGCLIIGIIWLEKQITGLLAIHLEKCQRVFYVKEYGWNSINPFSAALDKDIAASSLGYFMNCCKKNNEYYQNGIYHYSLVRAFYELKKNSRLSLPKFQYVQNASEGVRTVKLRTAKDVIRFMATRLVNELSEKRRRMFLSAIQLHEYLALEYSAHHGSESDVISAFNKLSTVIVPRTIEEYQRSIVGFDFIVYKACKNNRRATELLKKLLKAGKYSGSLKADYIYALAQSGNVSIIKMMMPNDRLEMSTLRWLPRRVLEKVCYSSKYLIFGLHDDKIAGKYLSGRAYVNYFGKPYVEILMDRKKKLSDEHYRKVKELKRNKTK